MFIYFITLDIKLERIETVKQPRNETVVTFYNNTKLDLDLLVMHIINAAKVWSDTDKVYGIMFTLKFVFSLLSISLKHLYRFTDEQYSLRQSHG